MALIGLVLLAAATAFGIDIAAQNIFDVDIEVFGRTFATSPSAVFVAGVVTGMAGALGVMLLIDGLARRRRLRAERRETMAERERLAAAYEAEHPDHGTREAAAREGKPIDLRDRDREPERVRSNDDLPDRDRIVTH